MKHWSPRFAVALVLGGWVVWVALMDAPDRDESSTFGQFALAAATMVLLLWDLLVKLWKEAHARPLLRVVGPIYQFRHVTPRDRLAGATTRRKVSP